MVNFNKIMKFHSFRAIIKCSTIFLKGENMNDNIIVKGAKEHNLKNINLKIPRDKLVVITGLSGSRKVFFSF